MDLKSQQELFTIAYNNRSEEQYGIRIQGHGSKDSHKAKRRNRILHLIITIAHHLHT